ncbi:MAG TPA: hypothetical protein VEG68_00970, partial [Terriglobales bacterium]|nr:hypothetical protein [Terriglobales bacterium]
PGALSAYGILVSDVVKDYSRTVLWRITDQLPFQRLDQEFALLQEQAKKDFLAEHWQGRFEHRLSVDVRYRGQGYELTIPYTRGLHNVFHREHERRYGYSYAKREIELVTLRLRSSMKSAHAESASARVDLGARPVTGSMERVPVLFHARKLPTTIYDRDSLRPGKKLTGPAIVTEYSATTVVPVGKLFWLDDHGNLIIKMKTP